MGKQQEKKSTKMNPAQIAVVKKGIQSAPDNLKAISGIVQAQPGRKAPIVEAKVGKVTVKPAEKPVSNTIGKISSVITNTPKKMGGELKEVTVKGEKFPTMIRNMSGIKGEPGEYDYVKIDEFARKNKWFPSQFKIDPKLTPRQNRERIEGAMNSRTDLAQQMKNFFK